MPDHVAEGARWLRQAVQDLEDAEFTREGKRFNLACFLAQQADEKADKAYLYQRGGEGDGGVVDGRSGVVGVRTEEETLGE